MSSGELSPKHRKTVALAYGLVCHGLFGIAALTMIVVMGSGMTLGQGRVAEPWNWLVNLALLAQLPLGHSLLLTQHGQRILKWFAPRAIAPDMAPTVYVIVACAQLFALFSLWTPSGIVWWQAEGILLPVWLLLFAASWGLLGLSNHTSGIELQSGFNGWSAVFQGRRVRYPDLATHGIFRHTRNPIYFSFALTTWTVPVWTPDQLLVAIVLTTYCVLGPRFKEARYRRIHGERFEAYARAVPYFLPRLRPAPADGTEQRRSSI